MRSFFLGTVLYVLIAGSSAGQSGVFIKQISNGGTPSITQFDDTSGAYVQQMPSEARPSAPRSMPAKPNYVERDFLISRANIAPEDSSLVIYDDEGIMSYGEAERPALPAVGQGATVSLTGPSVDSEFPSVGAGAVLL